MLRKFKTKRFIFIILNNLLTPTTQLHMYIVYHINKRANCAAQYSHCTLCNKYNIIKMFKI